MTKQTKMILGVGAVALVGYFVWKGMKPKTANASGMAPKKEKCKEYLKGLQTKLSTLTENGVTFQAYPCAKPKGGYSYKSPQEPE